MVRASGLPGAQVPDEIAGAASKTRHARGVDRVGGLCGRADPEWGRRRGPCWTLSWRPGSQDRPRSGACGQTVAVLCGWVKLGGREWVPGQDLWLRLGARGLGGLCEVQRLDACSVGRVRGGPQSKTMQTRSGLVQAVWTVGTTWVGRPGYGFVGLAVRPRVIPAARTIRPAAGRGRGSRCVNRAWRWAGRRAPRRRERVSGTGLARTLYFWVLHERE